MKLILNIEIEIQTYLDEDNETIKKFEFNDYCVNVIEGNVIIKQIPIIVKALSNHMKDNTPMNFGNCISVGSEIPKLKKIIEELNEDKDLPSINQISDKPIDKNEF